MLDYFLLQTAEEESIHRAVPAGAPAAHAGQQGVVVAPAVKAHSDSFAKYTTAFFRKLHSLRMRLGLASSRAVSFFSEAASPLLAPCRSFACAPKSTGFHQHPESAGKLHHALAPFIDLFDCSALNSAV